MQEMALIAIATYMMAKINGGCCGIQNFSSCGQHQNIILKEKKAGGIILSKLVLLGGFFSASWREHHVPQ